MGEGEPLILLHGLGDSHRSWRNAAPHLARHYRVLMPDLPGHGLSGRPDASYTLAWYARFVLDWMNAIGVERAHVCGHSFGGGVAQWMLLCDSTRVRSLALVAAGGLGREVAVGLRLASIPYFGPRLTPHFMGLGTRAMMQKAIGDGGDIDPDEIERAVWMNNAPGTGRAFQRTVVGCVDLLGQHAQTWAHIDEIEELPPIAIFWGEKDRMIPVRHCHCSAKRLKGARVFTYPDCSHFLQLENAWGFARDLVAFLDHPGPAASLRPRPAHRLPALTDMPSRIADTFALTARRLIHTLRAA
jgi:pimeloyl-ACP methyl ester carboxylesterase